MTSSTMTSAPQFLSSVMPAAKSAMLLEALWKANAAPGARSWTISPKAAPSSVPPPGPLSSTTTGLGKSPLP